MSLLTRKLAAAVTILTFAVVASGGLVGCAVRQDVPVRTADIDFVSNHPPGYAQVPFGSNDPWSAAGIVAVNALLFGLSAMTGGHPLAPADDSSKSPFDQSSQ